MALSHFQPLLLLLVASLFFLPTSHGIKAAFTDCRKGKNFSVTDTSLYLVEDDNLVSVKISGHTSERIGRGFLYVLVKADGMSTFVKRYPICKQFDCPVTSGPDDFVLSFNKSLPYDSSKTLHAHLFVTSLGPISKKIICLDFGYGSLPSSRSAAVSSA